MVSFIACTCPNRSGVGAIDNPGLSEQVFEQYDIPDVPEKIRARPGKSQERNVSNQDFFFCEVLIKTLIQD